MSVRTQYDQATNTYSLGDDIDGVFISFVDIPGDTVQGRIASFQVAQANATTEPSSAGAKVSGNTGDDFDPADFTDNGDGSYTRKSDGVQGRFTPAGFQPITAP